MKTSMESVAMVFDLAVLQGWPAFVYLLVGVVLTAIIQSSSAVMLITLSALSFGLVDLPSAAALVVGADLGTTSTMVLGGIKASAIKKQLALAHVLINVVTSMQAFLLLPWYLHVIAQGFGVSDPLFSLVAFHSSFNLIGIVILMPFLTPFSRFLEQQFSSSDVEVRAFIHNVPAAMPVEGVLAVSKEVERMLVQVCALSLKNMKMDVATLRISVDVQQRIHAAFPKEKGYLDCYDDIKKLEGEVLEFSGQLQAGRMASDQLKKLHNYLHAGRHSVYAAKSLKDIRENLVALRHTEKPALQKFYGDQIMQQKAFLARWLLLLCGKHDLTYLRSELNELRLQNQTRHQNIESRLFHLGLHEGADEKETSTVLNVNRELLSFSYNLIKSVGFLRLEDEPLVD